jgi:hypothetical protein
MFQKQDQRQAFDRRLKESKNNMGKIADKEWYSQNDFLEFYESVKNTTIYQVYESMDYWPIFDTMAIYGHILSNAMIVLTAIFFNVSFLMCFNVLCVCLYYSLATVRLNKRAEESFQASGILN